MELARTPLRRPRRRSSLKWAIFAVVFVLIAFILLSFYFFLGENRSHVTPDFNGLDKPIFYRGGMLELSAIGEGESLKLPFTAVKSLLDPGIVYEEETESVIITTNDKVVRLKTNQLTGLVNEKPFTLRFPVEKVGNDLYLPITPLREYYNVELRESANTGAVILMTEGDIIQWGKVPSDQEHPERTVPMRTEPTAKAPIISDLAAGQEVMIWSEKDGWYYIQTDNGYTGYAKKTDIVLDRAETVPKREEKDEFVPWKPIGGKINLSWEHVTTKNPDPSRIGNMPGLNVISPTWFHLLDGEGNIKNMADASYVKWAHDHHYHVWALFSNSFDPDITTKALSTYDTRIKMAKQLLAFAEMYRLQGINIDFENVYLKDKENLTQFVRELTPLLHEQGLVVSIDVTAKSTSEMWSMFYDRQALGQIVDYMMVMTYDEHWATSPEAGSVASLPWVEKGVVDIMRQDNVPPSKIVLGVPYYTRLWTEQPQDGKIKVTSKALSMEAVKKIIAEKKLKPVFKPEAGQNYVEYKEGDKTYKIWIEDAVSMKARAELVKKYDLAGIASWRRGFEAPEIWDAIKSTLEKRP